MLPYGNVLGRITSAAELGRRVRTRRRQLGLSQQRCADLCGVGRRFLSELENGKPTLALGLVLQVLGEIGLPVLLADPDDADPEDAA
ncbi:MAG: helix-turn-helix domain-containing protein [Alphaproteobacteria bacterium]|nr:helix-turn-helix domain-containing protein [Alphaproteobacteria bacterium]